MPCAVKSHILEASRQPARPFGWLWMIWEGRDRPCDSGV